MSKYTVELRYVVEQTENDNPESTTTNEYIDEVYQVLGLDSYPIWQETYRPVLNDKIINHFYMREIGFETVGLFRRMMRRTMAEIMPYYNQLYASQSLITSPMTSKSDNWSETWTRDNETRTSDDIEDHTSRSETFERDASRTREEDTEDKDTHVTNNTEDTTVTGTRNNRHVYEEVPMGSLDTAVLEGPSINYATTIDWDDTGTEDVTDGERTEQHSGTLTRDSTIEDKEDTNESRNVMDTYTRDNDGTRTDDEEGTRNHMGSGYDRPQAELLKIYRETFLNIDMEVIDDLEVLFMQIW